MTDTVTVQMSTLIVCVENHARAIKELRRELALRERVFPAWVRQGRMTAVSAQRHYDNMLEAHKLLMALLRLAPIAHPHELETGRQPNPWSVQEALL